jgi:hypothetical protein
MTGAVDRYLDELVVASRGLPPRRLRHLLAETEDHLRDAASAAERDGLTVAEAEVIAVDNFGPARELVAAERSIATPIPVLARQVALSGVLLGGIGAIAVGFSGVVAAIIRVFGGSHALVDVPGTGRLSVADCARWLAQDPGTNNCRSAAVADWAAETVWYRIALGVLGVVAVLVARRVAARIGRRSSAVLLDRRTSDTIACTLFVAAGASTLALGVDRAATAGTGWGQWLSAAAVALSAAAFYGVRLTSELRRPLA